MIDRCRIFATLLCLFVPIAQFKEALASEEDASLTTETIENEAGKEPDATAPSAEFVTVLLQTDDEDEKKDCDLGEAALALPVPSLLGPSHADDLASIMPASCYAFLVEALNDPNRNLTSDLASDYICEAKKLAESDPIVLERWRRFALLLASDPHHSEAKLAEYFRRNLPPYSILDAKKVSALLLLYAKRSFFEGQVGSSALSPAPIPDSGTLDNKAFDCAAFSTVSLGAAMFFTGVGLLVGGIISDNDPMLISGMMFLAVGFMTCGGMFACEERHPCVMVMQPLYKACKTRKQSVKAGKLAQNSSMLAFWTKLFRACGVDLEKLSKAQKRLLHSELSELVTCRRIDDAFSTFKLYDFMRTLPRLKNSVQAEVL